VSSYGRHLLTAVFVCGQLVGKNSLAKLRSYRTGLEVEAPFKQRR